MVESAYCYRPVQTFLVINFVLVHIDGSTQYGRKSH